MWRHITDREQQHRAFNSVEHTPTPTPTHTPEDELYACGFSSHLTTRGCSASCGQSLTEKNVFHQSVVPYISTSQSV